MRVGIISLYHNNRNYGGLLQAYALQKVISEIEGCEALQIAYDPSAGTSNLCRWNNKKQSRREELKKQGIRFVYTSGISKARRLKERYLYSDKGELIHNYISSRNKAMEEFENIIPHTEVVNEKTSETN